MSVINEGEDSDASDNSLDSCIKTPEDKEKKKEYKKDSLTMYSTDFFSYMQYNPILFYFFTKLLLHIIYLKVLL